MPNKQTPVTGVILAGGQGQRMGGQDKGWVPFRNQPLIQHVLKRLQPQVDEVIINANRSLADYSSLGCRVVTDLHEGYHGPLLGIATGLSHAEHDWVVFVPCDGPFLSETLVDELLVEAHRSDAPIVVADDGERLQPMVVLIHRRVLPDLLQALAEGERKPDRWYQQTGMAQVTFSRDSLYNFNYPEQLREP